MAAHDCCTFYIAIVGILWLDAKKIQYQVLPILFFVDHIDNPDHSFYKLKWNPDPTGIE